MDQCFKFLTFEIFPSSLFLIIFSSLLNPEYLIPDKNDSTERQRTCLNAKKVLTFLLSVLTSDWLKQQKLKKLHKAVPRDYKGDREGIPHIHPIP